MPHVSLVALSGCRVREPEMLRLGMQLPGLHDRARAIGALPALGLLTLAGMTPDTWSVSYHDPERADDSLIETLVREGPDLVAISALTASVLDAYRLSRKLRAEGVRVVIGGLHATACPEEVLGHADSVVIGDGEPVWLEILADVEQGRIAQRYQGTRPFDLEEAPIPRFDLLSRKERARFTIQTARGCPFACDFCGASRLLGNFREKPVAVIEQELAALTRLHARPVLELADDNTFAGRRAAADLLDVLSEAGIRYFTEADWRLGERPEILRGLAQSGCVQVLVGIESLVFQHGGMGAKKAELERVMESIEAIQGSGVAVNGCFIVGSDGEDEASIDRLGDFIESTGLAEVQLTLLTPFPGTALYRRLSAEGRLLPDRDWSYYTLFDLTYRPELMTVEALEQSFARLVRRVFGREQTRRRQAIRRAIWRQASANREREVGHE